MAQATSPPYVGSPVDNSDLLGTVGTGPILAQRGVRDATANADRADHPVEAGSPTIATAEAYPQTIHTSIDPPPYQQMLLAPLQCQ